MTDDVAGEGRQQCSDALFDAVVAFWDAWRAYAKLPEDERSGVAIGEVMDTLARDPQFILTAAEKLLREAGAKRLMLLGAPHDIRSFVELGTEEFPEHVTGVEGVTVDADALPEAYAKLKEARNG